MSPLFRVLLFVQHRPTIHAYVRSSVALLILCCFTVVTFSTSFFSFGLEHLVALDLEDLVFFGLEDFLFFDLEGSGFVIFHLSGAISNHSSYVTEALLGFCS